MMKHTFKVDFETKTISLPAGRTLHTARELYSYLMDVFDEPENLEHEIPIQAISKNKFTLINGWKIDRKATKYIEGLNTEIVNLP